MTNNLRNNMLSSLTSILNNNNISIDDEVSVDIETILINAKNDKRFYKLLNLCIKYDIHLFNQCNNNCILLKIDKLLYQTNQKQKNILNDLSQKISNITINNNSITTIIDNIYCVYKKKLKDIEIIIYILQNIFDDDALKTLCCVKHNTSSSSPSNKNSSSKVKSINNLEMTKKYIAVYSN